MWLVSHLYTFTIHTANLTKTWWKGWQINGHTTFTDSPITRREPSKLATARHCTLAPFSATVAVTVSVEVEWVPFPPGSRAAVNAPLGPQVTLPDVPSCSTRHWVVILPSTLQTVAPAPVEELSSAKHMNTASWSGHVAPGEVNWAPAAVQQWGGCNVSHKME